MTAPSHAEIAEMAKLLRLMQGDRQQAPSAEKVTRGMAAAMDGALARLTEDAASDPALREAVATTRTLSGARIGQWEIAVREIDGHKSYDVHRADDQSERIAQGLILYEAALGLVRLLNAGRSLNSPEVFRLLEAEHHYMGARNDAILFKKRLGTERDARRKAILETRYTEAREKAIKARETIRAEARDLD